MRAPASIRVPYVRVVRMADNAPSNVEESRTPVGAEFKSVLLELLRSRRSMAVFEGNERHVPETERMTTKMRVVEMNFLGILNMSFGLHIKSGSFES